MILCFLTTFLISYVISFVAWDLYRKRRILNFASQFGGYQFLPIIGNGYQFMGPDMLAKLRQLVDRYKLPCNLWDGHQYHYVTSDPEEAKVILNHPNTVEKAEFYQNFTSLVNTLLCEPHEQWKGDRKLLSRSFGQSVLNSLVKTFYKNSCWLADKLNESQPKLTLDVFAMFSIKSILGGQNEELTAKECEEIPHHLDTLERVVERRYFMWRSFPDIFFAFTRDGRQSSESEAALRKFASKIIRSKRLHMDKVKDTSGVFEKNLVEHFMRNGDKWTNEELSLQIYLLVFASIHTTATTLMLTCTLLGMHPDIQEKVYQEVIETVGLTEPITENDLPNLKFTEMVIQETLRILPTVIVIGRHVTNDLKIGAKTVPAGSNVVIDIFHMHRSEKLWKSPKKFDPYRFLPEESANQHPYSFIPFSAGARNCIGMKYAMMAIKTALANVIRNHKVHSNYQSVDDIPVTGGVLIRFPKGLDCKFSPRN